MQDTAQAQRLSALDALRGVAMLWMTGFHFCFDLQEFGYIQTDFYTNPVWTLQRSCIVSLFVLCAGLGQSIAFARGQTWRRFWQRWWQIAACAVLVSVATYIKYPQSFIYCGILHGMALMLVVQRLLALAMARYLSARWVAISPAVLSVLAALAWLAPSWALQWHQAHPSLEFLNDRAWNWLGLISHKPITQDYAPLLPWLGVMLWGVALGQYGQSAQGQWLAYAAQRLARSGAVARLAKPLAVLGRWPLSYYMLHQPLLIAGFMLVAWLR